ncbi:hypothetical protein C7R27_02750 [Staphylococcus aureus]|uniref:hypothetical protein n=1 Tax=Staphylococcus aureus TaxID=1280 RepID=UPI000DA820AC|nr:hypothetical protein [Staphylococcus aureus]PZG69490.1 hypothetical protein C7R27_02750 [Staphylococcus aureus]
MSVKSRIFEALEPLNINIAHGYSDDMTLPKIITNVISHRAIRLSDRKHYRHFKYQISYFDKVPRDVEDDEILISIMNALENANLVTNEWTEIVEPDEDTEETIFHYILEVCI